MAETTETVEEKQQPSDAETQEQSKTSAQSVEFEQAGESVAKGPGNSIDLLLDMEAEITVSIGKTQIPIKQLLQLAPGSVIKLQKNIEEPADLYLNESRFATGSIVVVEDSFAIKITDVLNVMNPDSQQQEQ